MGLKPWLLLLLLLLFVLLLSGTGSKKTSMTEEEKRVAATLSSVAGAGNVRVTLYYEESASGFGGAKKPVGALAVASGARDMNVRLSLTLALETLLDLEPGRVLVLEMEEQK